MPDDSSLRTVRAAVETIAPPVDGRPGAVDLGVDAHVSSLVDMAIPGFVDLIAMLLDAYATSVRDGAAFAELSTDERGQVIRAMAGEESADVRDVIDALMVFTYGGLYSEWSAFDRTGRQLPTPPGSWGPMGYHGPAEGHPNYRRDA